MKLNIMNIEEIVAILRLLEESKIRTDHFIVANHKITVQKHEDQRDGAWVEVTSIEQMEK